MRRYARWLAMTSLALLAACGGGENAALSPGAALLTQHKLATVADALCNTGNDMYVKVDGQCVQPYKELGLPALNKQAGGQGFAPLSTIEEAAFFDWAESVLGSIFPRPGVDGVLGMYTYRYYPQLGNVVAVANGSVYVLGPAFGDSLLYIGPLSDYTCVSMPGRCAGIGAAKELLLGGSINTHTQYGRFFSVNLKAGLSYAFTVAGQPFSGTLDHPKLTLLAPNATEIASAVWTFDLVTRINYTAKVSGLHYLEVSDPSNRGGSYTIYASERTSTPAPVVPVPVPVSQVCEGGKTLSWSVGGSSCSATTPSFNISGSVTIGLNDNTAPTTGSADAVCSNGAWSIRPGSESCSEPRTTLYKKGRQCESTTYIAAGDAYAASVFKQCSGVYLAACSFFDGNVMSATVPLSDVNTNLSNGWSTTDPAPNCNN